MTSIHKKWTKKNCVGKCFNFFCRHGWRLHLTNKETFFEKCLMVGRNKCGSLY